MADMFVRGALVRLRAVWMRDRDVERCVVGQAAYAAMLRGSAASPGAFLFRLPVWVDPYLAPNVAELRDAEGKVLARETVVG